MKRSHFIGTMIVFLTLLCAAEPIVLSEVRTRSGVGGWTNSMSLTTTFYSRTNTSSVAKCAMRKDECIGSTSESADHSLRDTLLSGLVGALLAVLLQVGGDAFVKSRDRYSLLMAVVSECNFNLGILDEIAQGVAQGINGSYKRVKNDFFLELRKVSFQYHFTNDLYESMARVACDEELLNRELDELQRGLTAGSLILTGQMTLVAINGVRGSLKDLHDKVDSARRRSMFSILDAKGVTL